MFEDILKQQMTKDFRCVVARWLDQLDLKDEQMVEHSIKSNGIGVTFRACRNYGYQGSESAFYRHAKGECPCSIIR